MTELKIVKTETRQEHYDECKAKGWSRDNPEFEIVTPQTVTHVSSEGAKVLARDADHNHTDIRDVYEDGSVGPWRRA